MDDAVLHDLQAREAIRQAIYRYARGIDRLDRELAISLWHRGGTAFYKDTFEGTGEGFIDWLRLRHQQPEVRAHAHQMGNILIEVDGDRAASETYGNINLQYEYEPGVITHRESRSRYFDRWSFRDGRWGVDHRICVYDTLFVTQVPADLIDVTAGRGSRGPDDESYAVFASLKAT